MRLSKRNTVILAVCLIALFAGAAVWAVGNGKSADNNQLASDIAAMSGLSKSAVLRLYDAIEDWDTVRQNIFVYKKILDTLEIKQAAYKEVFGLITKYKAEDVLAVYEFLAANDSDFSLAGELLAEHAKGTEMQFVLSNALNMKDFKHYKPADEELIRSWMKDGYTPQDILNADSIARAKDMNIEKVLELKKNSESWEQVGNQLAYKFENANDKATLNIKKAAGNQTISAEDYESAVKKANAEAEKEKEKIEQEICREHNLTRVQLGKYKEDGFSVWEVKNAARLAEKSGTSMDEILQERKAGKSWEEIINSYSG
ncbi:hypothetical protein [Phosphitispora fastidiosa]|uniref:hypothetical protein n=1 Tax=Phosphitispora fastidiosa TaxID=2837202 RepID=UPI001E4AF4E6|nr:hypothetical protein [Phosphitispora fastidiosa]MBU7006022.1 hypothetical protein [Phosphitispora fastidiosa]